jgi:Flp pilus assembly protein TadG
MSFECNQLALLPIDARSADSSRFRIGSRQKRGAVLTAFGRILKSDCEGGALVEMAVSMPLLMIIMTGIFSFSLALYQKVQLTEAVSNAGHVLATDRGDHDPCATVTNAIYNSTPTLSQGLLTIQISLNGQIESPSSSCPGAGTSSPNQDLENAQGKNAQVLVTYPTTLNFLNIWQSGGGFGTITLGSQITEVVQ